MTRGRAHPPAITLITGIPGAGKTAVARALAARFPRGVHVEGDTLQGDDRLRPRVARTP